MDSINHSLSSFHYSQPSEGSSSRAGNSRSSILSQSTTATNTTNAPRKLTRTEKLSEESSESSGSGESRRVLLSDLQNFLSGMLNLKAVCVAEKEFTMTGMYAFL